MCEYNNNTLLLLLLLLLLIRLGGLINQSGNSHRLSHTQTQTLLFLVPICMVLSLLPRPGRWTLVAAI